MIDTTGKAVAEVIDECLQAIIDQGGRCVDGYDVCAYSNGMGKHCAVGWLLPEDSEVMGVLGSVLDLCAERFDLGINGKFIHDNKQELSYLQDFHDNCYGEARLTALGCNPDLIKEWVALTD